MDFNDFDGNEEDEEKGFMYGGKDGWIFLIDASLPMFQKDEEDETPFKTCIECCKTLMLKKINCSERDLVALVLFGTTMADNELKAPHIVTLQELTEPSAEKIKQLENIVDNFEDKFGHSNDFLMSDTLWLCQTIFSKSVYKLSTFRIMLFTNSSDPHPNDTAKQHQARVRASDLAQANIELELFHMGDDFDPSIFYKELIQLASDQTDIELLKPTSSFDELMARICRLNHKRRSLCKVSFHLGNDVSLAVNLYSLVRKTPMPSKVFLDQATNKPVKSVTQYYDIGTAEIMLPAEVMKCQKIGGKQILFRFDETREIRKITKPGMELLGFKSSSCVKVYHHIKPSSFIYPDDSLIQGSSALFLALLERCTAWSVVPICYLTPRQYSTPKLVALLPQLEKLNKKNTLQELPSGFHMIYLPYVDNIRTLELKDNPRASPDQVAKFSQILKTIQFKYKPESFENPKIEVLRSNIEALALDHEAPREVPDFTRPNHNQMKKQMGSLAQEILTMIYPAGYDPHLNKKKVYAKRPAEKLIGGASKVPKAGFVTDDELNDLISKGTVNKLTVNQLKTLLSGKNVHSLSTKKKEDLVNMVYELFEPII